MERTLPLLLGSGEVDVISGGSAGGGNRGLRLNV